MRGSQPWRTNRAWVLRSAATSAEDKLWQELRSRKLDGLKFVRQSPVGPYFADFVCREKKIVMEIDGGTHATDAEIASDEARSKALEVLGYRIFRAHNVDIYENLDGVLDTLLEFIHDKTD